MRHQDEGNHLGPIKGELSVDDLKGAERKLLCVQREAFKEHFSQVMKSESPSQVVPNTDRWNLMRRRSIAKRTYSN